MVGGIGKVLIATGLLMFGFVAYQLWGTGLEYTQAQNRLEDDFAELLETSTPVAPTTTVTATSVPPSVATTSPPTTTAPTATTAPSATTSAPSVSVPDFAAGDVMAFLEIPSIDVATYVVSGVQPADLKRGPGHYPDTPQPGQLGNSAIAGHRTTFGQPFYDLDELQPGDEIVVRTVQGRFVYRVTGSEVVAPDRSDVVATTDPTVAQLTLTTCDPAYTARNRLVVHADLDEAASNAPAQQPIIAPQRPVDTTTPPATTDVSSSTDPSAPATTAAPPVTEPITPPGASEELADAFAHGWFSDDGAFAQVALWGIVVSAISVGAWLLSRRVRRNWVGALVGLLPFLVALYFLFQNVNRLLPAAL